MRHVIRLGYALFAYTLAIATVAYAAGFFGNLYLPRTIDSAAVVKFDDALSVNLALLMLFGLQHAGMRRPAFRYRLRRWIPGYAERSTCVTISCFALIALMALWQPMGGVVWDIQGRTAAYAVMGLYFGGWAILVFSTVQAGLGELLGVRPVLDVERGIPRSLPVLATPGMYRFVRQPIYLGWVLVLWSAPVMTVTRLVAAAGLSACIVVGVLLDEHELARAMPGYAQYRRKVPMLIPSLTRHLEVRSDAAPGTETG